MHVLIPSYNRRDVLMRCLESVLAAGLPPGRVLVVDDASADGSAKALREHLPGCQVLVNPTNRGFAGSCNRGLSHLRSGGAEFVLLLNQDTVIAPDLPATLAACMAAHPRAAAVGAKTFSTHPMPDGRERLIYAGSWQGRLPLEQRIPGINRAEDDPAHGAIRTDFIWGHGMLLRVSALDEVGDFDLAFPMYYEDLDLCRRFREAGYELWCERGAVMWHDQPDGARAVSSEYWRWACKVRSTMVYLRKHHGRVAAPFLAALTVAAELRQLVGQGHLRAAGHLARAAARRALGFSDRLRGPNPEPRQDGDRFESAR